MNSILAANYIQNIRMTGFYQTRIENQIHEAQPDKLILQSSALAPTQLPTSDKKRQTPEPEGGPGVFIFGWRCLTSMRSPWGHETHFTVLPHLKLASLPLSSRRARYAGQPHNAQPAVSSYRDKKAVSFPYHQYCQTGLCWPLSKGSKTKPSLNKNPLKVSSFAQIILKLVSA